MSLFFMIHLVVALFYLFIGMLAYLKNRYAKINRVFGFLMLLFVGHSLLYFVLANNENTLDVNSSLMLLALFLKLFIPPTLLLLILYFARTKKLLKYRFFTWFIFTIPFLLVIFILLSDYTIEESSFGFVFLFKNNSIWFIDLVYVSFLSMFSLAILLSIQQRKKEMIFRDKMRIVVFSAFLISVFYIVNNLQMLLFKKQLMYYLFDVLSVIPIAFIYFSLAKSKLMLFSSEEVSEHILENIIVPIFITDKKNNISYVNQAFIDFATVTEYEVIGKGFISFFPEFEYDIKNLFIDGDSLIRNIESTFYHQNGLKTKVLLSGRRMMTNSDEFQGDVFTMELLSERPNGVRYVNEQLRVQNAYKASGIGFWEWNIDTGELYFSDELLSLYGYYKKDFVGITFNKWKEYIHPEDIKEYFRHLNNHLRGETKEFLFEYRVKTNSGVWKWVLDTAKIISFDANKSPLLISGVISEISSFKHTEMELKKSQKKLQENIDFQQRLLGVLSTDIRDPFNAIIGLTEMLTFDDDTFSTSQKENLNAILKNAQSSFNLISKIIEWSKLEEGVIELKKEKIVLKEFIDSVINKYADKINEKDIRVINETEEEYNFLSDPDFLEEVLSLLLHNVFVYSHVGGKVVISCDKRRSLLFIDIAFSTKVMPKIAKNILIDIESMINMEGTEYEKTYVFNLLVAKKIVSHILGGNIDLTFPKKGNDKNIYSIELPIQYF